MSPTRRDVFKYGAAALAAVALPLKETAAAPAREVTTSGLIYWFGRLDGERMQSRTSFVRGYADGTGEVIFQATPENAPIDVYEPDYEIGKIRLDASQFAVLLEAGFTPIG